MKFTRSGIILCTQHYEECVRFYLRELQSPILQTPDNEHSKLTCLATGAASYWMIETRARAVPSAKTIESIQHG